MKRGIVWKFERFCCCCCFAMIGRRWWLCGMKVGAALLQKWRCFHAEVSVGCPRSPGVIAVRESAGNWQASLCIRKLITLRSRVLCQLKSSGAGRWKRGQPHFCAAAVWRLASDCCRHWLYSANSLFDWLNHPYTAGRWIRERFHPYQHHVFWCLQSVRC